MADEPIGLADACRLLRERTGLGLMDCKRAVSLSDGPDFEGDVLLALLYVDASGLAVHVKGDRHRWNLGRARSRIGEFRDRHPELSAAFPAPDDAPSPSR